MTAGNTCGFNDACSSYNSMDISTTVRESASGREKPEIKSIREKRRINPNKTCSGSVVEVSVGYILEIGSDRRISVWQSGEY